VGANSVHPEYREGVEGRPAEEFKVGAGVDARDFRVYNETGYGWDAKKSVCASGALKDDVSPQVVRGAIFAETFRMADRILIRAARQMWAHAAGAMFVVSRMCGGAFSLGILKAACGSRTSLGDGRPSVSGAAEPTGDGAFAGRGLASGGSVCAANKLPRAARGTNDGITRGPGAQGHSLLFQLGEGREAKAHSSREKGHFEYLHGTGAS